MCVGLGRAHVVDGVVGHRVCDDVSLGADPACSSGLLQKTQKVWVWAELVFGQHDAVGGLAGVGDGSRVVQCREEGSSNERLDAIGGEEDVACNCGRLARGGWGFRSEARWLERCEIAAGGGEVEVYGGLSETALVDGARQRAAMIDHVWVAKS